jgi:hypothetical protein
MPTPEGVTMKSPIRVLMVTSEWPTPENPFGVSAPARFRIALWGDEHESRVMRRAAWEGCDFGAFRYPNSHRQLVPMCGILGFSPLLERRSTRTRSE